MVARLLLILGIISLFPVMSFAQDKPDTISGAVIDRTLYDARYNAHKCYTDNVPVSQRGQGENARITIRIDYDGMVTSAIFEDTTVQEKAARDCLLGLAKRLRFQGKAKGFTTVTIWFGLSTELGETVVRAMDPPKKKITSKDIVATAQKRMSEFMGCYNKHGNDQAGVVKLTIIVGATGSVTEARIDQNTFPNTTVSSCIQNIARTLKFDAPGDDAPVIAKIPFKFSTQ